MTNQQLEDLAKQHVIDKAYVWHEDDYIAGFKKALELVLEKREEFGHGYLKSKLLDWIVETLENTNS